MYGSGKSRRRVTHSDSESDSESGYSSYTSSDDDGYDSWEDDAVDGASAEDGLGTSDLTFAPEPGEEETKSNAVEEGEEATPTSALAGEILSASSDDGGRSDSGSDSDSNSDASSSDDSRYYSESDSGSDFSDSDSDSDDRSDDDRRPTRKHSSRHDDEVSDSDSDSDSDSSDASGSEDESDGETHKRVTKPQDDDESGDSDADEPFTQEFLNNYLQKVGYDRHDFDILAFSLYVLDLADLTNTSQDNAPTMFRVARFINATLPDTPMGVDIETHTVAINALANSLAANGDHGLLEHSRTVAQAIDGGTDDTPSNDALRVALPLVLSYTKDPHPDVVAILRAVFPDVKAPKPSKKAPGVFPLKSDEQAQEIYAALQSSDEATAQKLLQTFQSQTKPGPVPIALRLDDAVFEERLRAVPHKGLDRVAAAIPIEGPGVADAFSTDAIEQALDTTSESFVRGAPLGVTLDSQPNSETAFEYMRNDFLEGDASA